MARLIVVGSGAEMAQFRIGAIAEPLQPSPPAIISAQEAQADNCNGHPAAAAAAHPNDRSRPGA
jgi:hypothetical protein